MAFVSGVTPETESFMKGETLRPISYLYRVGP